VKKKISSQNLPECAFFLIKMSYDIVRLFQNIRYWLNLNDVDTYNQCDRESWQVEAAYHKFLEESMFDVRTSIGNIKVHVVDKNSLLFFRKLRIRRDLK